MMFEIEPDAVETQQADKLVHARIDEMATRNQGRFALS